jgi:hypothetical protein
MYYLIVPEETAPAKDNAPQNFAILRQIALNLLNREKTVKAGVKRKRNKAGWDDDELVLAYAVIKGIQARGEKGNYSTERF